MALCLLSLPAYGIPAFPGAEGYGANSTGGRNGDVYHVTSLADTNTVGTLRYGINNAPAAGRTIVFDISGMITLTNTLQVNKNKVTIAGETAPEQGICLKNHPFEINASNVTVRNIRSRLGTDANQEDDCMTLVGGDNIMIDHCSASWSVDEVLSVKQGATAVHATVQNSFIVEALYDSIHSKGPHSYGSLIRPGVNAWYSWYNNLYADNWSRNPRPGYDTSQTLVFDFRNNVIYNWVDQAGYTADDGSGCLKMNYVGNYAIVGPSGTKVYIFNGANISASELQIYQSGNKMDANKNGVADGNDNGWGMFTGVLDGSKMTSEFAMDPNYPAVYTLTADAALETVLNYGGAFFWNRDTADANVVAQVRSYGTAGAIYDTVAQAGGYPTYPQTFRDPNVYDTDKDGMLNSWETSHGLDPNVYDANGDIDNDGYTNLEEYLHWLSPIPPPKPIVWLGGSSGTAGRYELIANWDIPWQPTLADKAEINSGKATVAYPNQEAGTLYVANTAAGSAELSVTAGKLTIGNALHLGSASGARGTASISGGMMAVSGSLALGGGGSGAVGLLTLTGGSLTATGPIVLASGASSTGELKVAKPAYVEVGGLTINSGGGRSTKVLMELDANGPSLIRTTGAATLAGTLAVDRTTTAYRPSQGNPFTLILATSGTSNFGSITSNIPGLLLKDPNTPALGYWPIFRGAFDANADYVVTFQGAMAGDAGGDNKVNAADLGDLAANWGQSGRSWTQADFGGDGQVNAADLGDLAANWGQTGLAPSAAPPETPVPEPASAILFVTGVLGLLQKRRRV